jgi:hypothetical protein
MKAMQGTRWEALWAFAIVGGLVVGCNKAPSVTDAPAPAASAAAVAPSAAAPAASVASAAAPLTGFDTCLVGAWKGTSFSLKTDQVSAEGGANVALKIAASGDSVIDFGPMSAVNGKGAGASFDFQYSGKATATLSTPARGTIASAKPDYSALKVSTNVQIPGAGKIAVFKNKPVSELAQMASAVVGGKVPAAGAPPGIDASPVFSNSRYSCDGDTLTLSDDKLAAQWVFTRVSN